MNYLDYRNEVEIILADQRAENAKVTAEIKRLYDLSNHYHSLWCASITNHCCDDTLHEKAKAYEAEAAALESKYDEIEERAKLRLESLRLMRA